MNEVRPAELVAAYAHCRAVAKREAKNFYYSFVALPRHKSDAMCAVYAFMRKADDLADDESMTLEARRAAMAAWTAEWRASRGGATGDPVGDPVFRALNDTQRRFGISDELLEQLVAGTTMDLQPQPDGVMLHSLPDGRVVQVYESFTALQHYCYLVASVVGLVCIKIFGYNDRHAEQLAIDTGIAFQLTNILRDVKEDAERGRVYLSADLLREHDVSVQRVIELAGGSAVGTNELALLKGLELHAQTLYRSGYALIPLLDRDAQPAMRVLIRIYHGLLDKIAADPGAVFRERVSVSTAEKLRILAVGMAQSFVARVSG